MASLIEIAHFFALAAESSKDKVNRPSDDIGSNEKLLAEMVEENDFDGMVEFAEGVKDWNKLGVGSSRTIYQISDSLILKIAHNNKGIDQNLAEMSMQGSCLNNVLVADSKGRWVIVRFTETMKEEDFKDYVGFGFNSFSKALHYKGNNEQHDDKPTQYEEIIESPMFKGVFKAIIQYDLQIGDIAKSSSWGLLDGRPVIRDFGLTKDVYRDHYKSDSDTDSHQATSSSTSRAQGLHSDEASS